jgi:hypothetical protein
MFYGISPFFIVLVAIVGYFTYRIVDVHYRSKRDLSASAGGVEKTLNDIPA